MINMNDGDDINTPAYLGDSRHDEKSSKRVEIIQKKNGRESTCS